MAEAKSYRYFLEVNNGTENGLVYYLGDDPVLIGSGSAVGLRIDAPGVKQEHVLVSLVQNRVWIENLSSSGTLLGGRPISKRTLVVPGEIFAIGDETQITLGVLGAKPKGNPANIIFPVLIGLIVIAGLVFNVAMLRRNVMSAAPVTQSNWNEAYNRISNHLQLWSEQSRLPRDFADQFSQAWFRERAGDPKGALAQWRVVYNAMTGLSISGVTQPGKTIAGSVEDNPVILHVFMGREWGHDPDLERVWKNLDQGYMNALWWFVVLRIEVLKKKIDN